MKRLLFISFLVTFTSVLLAQDLDFTKLPVVDYKAPRKYVIKEIEVTGIRYLDAGILTNISGLTVGQEVMIPGEDITRAIEKLWEQGLFSDIKIAATELKGDSVSLQMYLQELPRLSRFEITGLNKSKATDLKEKLEDKRGRQITENTINTTRDIVRNYLNDKKFLNADIEILQVDDTLVKMNNVVLKINITKNEKVKIKDIQIRGNEVLNDWKLRRAMKNTKKKNLNIFKGSKFIREDYEADKEKLLKEYYELGYRDARITHDTVYQVSDDRLMIEIALEEGDQYFFREIDWVGNSKYPSDFLTRALKIERGDPYNIDLLQDRLNIDEDAVGNLYVDDGYLFFNVSPVISQIENDSIDIELRVFEGKRFRLNEVIINGNTETNDYVVRRELRTRPGDLFSKADIMRSQRELAQLGLFDAEQFGIEPININQQEGEVDLQYSLVERSNDQLEISGGWGAGMFVGTIGLRFSNFSVKRIFDLDAWKPVPMGDGQTLSLRAQSNGSYYKAYSFSFVEPWLGGKKPNSFNFSVYHTIRDNSEYFFNIGDESMKITGASLGLGRRLTVPDDYFTLSHSISYQRYNLENFTTYFFIDNGVSNNLSFGTTFGRNSIDQPLYPRRGSSFSLSLQITPPYSLFKEKRFWELSQSAMEGVQQEVEDKYSAYTDDGWLNILGEGNYMNESARQAYINSVAQNKIDDRENQDRYNWIEYHKWKYKGAVYLRLIDDLVLATNSEFGYLGYFSRSLGYSPFGSFDVGGDGMSGYSMYGIETIKLRGYTNGSLTPSDGANIYQKINVELRYPISLKPQATIYGLVFAEAGNAWYDLKEYSPFIMKRSLGVGVRAWLPMFGMLGVDWGYGFDDIPGNPDASGGQFHFVIGQEF